MSNYYDINGIIAELNKKIDLNESYLNAWLNVEFCTKKDGTYFKNMRQNFKNAAYYQDYDLYHYVLKVNVTPTKLNGYSNDSIRCYLNTHYDHNSVIKEKPENIRKIPYCYDIYVMDIEDIKAAVSDHIIQLKQEISDLKIQLDNCEKIYNEFKKDYSNVIENLQKNCVNLFTDKKDNDYISLFYMVKDTVIERYPYC